jgi:peptide/nickel transport system substrate-binding protein
MRKRMALVVAALVAVVVVALAVAPPAPGQKRGGVLKFAIPSVKPGLDPAHVNTGDGYMLTQAIFSNLTRVDENLEPRPQLAQRWEPSAGSSVWTFHLVRGVKFHNGREVTADDVVFSIDRILDPKTASRGIKALGPIKKVVAKDKYTVVFELTGPYADLPLQLGNSFARIVARENVEKIQREPIGSGPFRLKEYVPGSKVVLVRNPDYFEKGMPFVDEVHQVYIKEYAAQLSALTTGEIHIMYSAPVELIPQLKKEAGVEVLEVPSPNFQPFEMFVAKKPTSDVRVRQALRLAADRKAMLQASTGGHGVLGNDTPVPPSSKWFNKTLPQRERDVARAKQLLAEAGYPGGIDVTLYTSTQRPGLEEAAVVYRESAKEAGIRVKIESIEIARLYSEMLRKPAESTIVHNNWFGRPTIDETITPYVFTKSFWNYTEYSNPKVDALLTEAIGIVDFAKRKQVYDEVQRILWEEGPEVVPYFRNYVAAIRKNVKNYKLIPVQYVDLREVWLE